MPDEDRKLTRRKAAVGFGVLAAVATVGLLIADHRRPVPVAPHEPAAPNPPPSLPPPDLGRPELLAALDAGAAAYAAGQPEPADVRNLAGRRFRLTLSFGCKGQEPPGSPLSWSYDPEQKTLKLTARPEDFSHSLLVRDSGVAADAVEGFWIPRPWVRAEGCPPSRPRDPGLGPMAPAQPTAAMARFFTAGDARAPRRRGRPYELVTKSAEAPAPRPYGLVLSGRITALAGGRVTVCHAQSAEERPACLLSVVFDEVAIEDEGGRLGEWRD